MSNKVDLSSLEAAISQSIKTYSESPMPEETSKIQAIQVLSKEVKLISDEKKLEYELQNQKDRFELEKDHKYWSEKFEEKKLDDERSRIQQEINLKKEELELNKKRLRLETRKNNSLINVEKRRLDIEENNAKQIEQNRKDDLRFKYISLGLTIAVPMIMTFIELMSYRKLAYANLKLIYADEGRPTTDFKDAVKSVKNLIK